MRRKRLIVAAMVVLAIPVVGFMSLATAPVAANAGYTCVGTLKAAAVGMAATPDGGGYWVADSSGDIESCGDAPSLSGPSGNIGGIVAIAGVPGSSGFWLVSSRGNVVPFGTAKGYGDLSGMALNKPIVSIGATPDGGGYWLLAGDGGVFAYGDAGFYGSTGSIVLNKPAVGIAATADGKGYWFVASDGGIFAYGDAGFFGSMGNTKLNQPVIAMTTSPDGKGYRMVASDGGIFSFGDAPFYGSSVGSSSLPFVGMAPTPDSKGYWVLDQGGNVFSYGDAGGSSSTSTSTSAATSTTTPGSTTSTTTVMANPINPAAIPLGDGHVSTTPEVGYVDSCTTSFGGGGAEANVPWINSSAATWDSSSKLAVQGSVSWPSAIFSATTSGSSRIVTGNDEPDHNTGIFPIQLSDPAHQYDQNPNSIVAHNFNWTLPLNPQSAKSPQCLPMGVIGVLTDGVVLYNALDGEGRDAGAHEVLDSWGEHPDQSDVAHHHDVPSFLYSSSAKANSSVLVGYATDGYGIYAEFDANGNLLTNAQLDSCHGRTSDVMWNGQMQSVYHYDATLEYPYDVGCFMATPVNPQIP